MQVNQSEVCRMLKKEGLKVSQPTISKMVRDGILAKDKDGLIDLTEARQLVKEMNLVEPRYAELLKYRVLKEKWLSKIRELESKKREIELKVLDGRYLEKDATVSTVTERARQVRDSILNVAPRIAPILVTLNAFEAEQLMKKELTQALFALSEEEVINEQKAN